MIIEIQHETRFEYSEATIESLTELRMEPVTPAEVRQHPFRPAEFCVRTWCLFAYGIDCSCR